MPLSRWQSPCLFRVAGEASSRGMMHVEIGSSSRRIKPGSRHIGQFQRRFGVIRLLSVTALMLSLMLAAKNPF